MFNTIHVHDYSKTINNLSLFIFRIQRNTTEIILIITLIINYNVILKYFWLKEHNSKFN